MEIGIIGEGKSISAELIAKCSDEGIELLTQEEYDERMEALEELGGFEREVDRRRGKSTLMTMDVLSRLIDSRYGGTPFLSLLDACAGYGGSRKELRGAYPEMPEQLKPDSRAARRQAERDSKRKTPIIYKQDVERYRELIRK